MRIYVSHARIGNYLDEIYAPLRASPIFTEHVLTFPHEDAKRSVNSLELIPRCDLVLAEVSHPSTGQGIELGWAASKGVPILAFAREGAAVSTSLRVIAPEAIRYTTPETFAACVLAALEDSRNG